MNDIEAAVADLEAEFVDDTKRYEAGDYAELTDVATPRSTDATDIGLGHLALGNCERGREWVAAAVSGFFARFDAAVEQDFEFDQPVGADRFTDLRFALLNALISGDEATLQTVLADTVERLEDVPPERRTGQAHRAATCETIVAILTDDGPETALDRLLQVADKGLGEWGRVRATALEGIVAGDAESAHEGLEAILTYHRETVVGASGYSLPRQRVSHDTCGFLALAHRQGLDVGIESEYVPACIITAGDRTAD